MVDEHGGLYEYRPLLRDHLEERAHLLSQLPDTRIALDELRREPAAAIFVRGAADGPSAARTLFHAILLPLLVSTGEACGGFDWEDGAFDRVYGALEHSLFGAGRAYTAAAPLVGLSAGSTIELARGIRVERIDGADPERNCSAGVRAGALPLAASVERLARRSRRVRRRRHSAPARHGGGSRRRAARPRAARPPSAGAPTGARDRGDRAGRRADPARPVAREARRRPARPAAGLGARRRARRGARTLGALAVRVRAAPLGAPPGGALPRSSAAPTGSGRRRCGRPCWSARSASRQPARGSTGLLGLARGAGADAETVRHRPADLRRDRPRRRPATAPRVPRRGAARAARAPAGFFSARASAA